VFSILTAITGLRGSPTATGVGVGVGVGDALLEDTDGDGDGAESPEQAAKPKTTTPAVTRAGRERAAEVLTTHRL